MPASDFIRLMVTDPAEPMSSKRHKERCIVVVYRVEMNAHRHHAFQQREGRRDMLHPILDRPGAIADALDSFLNRDCPILVPPKRPIGGGALVEQNCPNGLGVTANSGGGDCADGRVD